MMNVSQIEIGFGAAPEIPRPTGEELQQEYDYYLAQDFTKRLLKAGLISKTEFDQITEKNQKTFAPLSYRILHGPGVRKPADSEADVTAERDQN